MKTIQFLEKLETTSGKHLEFEVEPGVYIAPTFHITEIKNASIESVDCGGNPDSYKQTIVQLWVNPEESFRESWTTTKALSIFNIVDKVKRIDRDAEVFFEYGDSDIRTSHFSVQDVIEDGDTLQIQLFAKPTVCKPSLKSNGVTACC